MSWSLSIGRIAGTAVRIHITFLLFLIRIWFAKSESGSSAAGLTGLLFMVMMFLCVLAHDFGQDRGAHGLISRRDLFLAGRASAAGRL